MSEQNPRLKVNQTQALATSQGHGVPLLETLPFLPGDPAAGPHAAAMAPSLLAKVMQHCIPQRSGCEDFEMTWF